MCQLGKLLRITIVAKVLTTPYDADPSVHPVTSIACRQFAIATAGPAKKFTHQKH